MKETVPDVIRAIVGQMPDNGNKMDTVSILQPEVVRYLYDKNNNEARWSREAKWTPVGSLLINFIENARLYGLFPEDYHFENISTINLSSRRILRQEKMLFGGPRQMCF